MTFEDFLDMMSTFSESVGILSLAFIICSEILYNSIHTFLCNLISSPRTHLLYGDM